MASVLLSEIDDYIGPSQACVNPLFTTNITSTATGNTESDNSGNNGSSESKPENDGKPLNYNRIVVQGVANEILDSAEKTKFQEILVRKDTKERKRKVIRKRISANQRSLSLTSSSVKNNDSSNSTKTAPPLVLEEEMEKNSLEINQMKKNQTIVPNKNTPKKVEKATVSVADCLACSGCVTSSEAVLVTRHSTSTLLENCTGFLGTYGKETPNIKNYTNSLSNPSRTIAFTISPACIADLLRFLYNDVDSSHFIAQNRNSNNYPIALSLFLKLSTFLHEQLGGQIILDGFLTNEISLIESAYEFIHRFHLTNHENVNEKCEKSNSNKKNLNIEDESNLTLNDAPVPSNTVVVPPPSIAMSSTETKFIVNDDIDDPTSVYTLSHDPGRNTSTNNERVHNPLPVLTSSCPGFVCYVEKTSPRSIPYLSSVKSSMAIGGALLKHTNLETNLRQLTNEFTFQESSSSSLSDHHSKSTSTTNGDTMNVYHIAIMPCHDKKLEASRKDLAWENQTIQSAIKKDGSSSISLIPDVDLVLTTDELLSLLNDVVVSASPEEKKIDDCSETSNDTKKDNHDKKGPNAKVSIRQYLDQLHMAKLSWTSNENKAIDYNHKQPYVFHRSTSFDLHLQSSSNFSSKNNQINTPSKSSLEPISISNTICQAQTQTLPQQQEKVKAPSAQAPISSGSYADFVFRYAAKELFQYEIPYNVPLPWKSATFSNHVSKTNDTKNNIRPKKRILRRRKPSTGGSSDLLEVVLYKDEINGSYALHTNDNSDENRTPVLRFATAYGFKNVQLMLQKIAKQSEQSNASNLKQYDYIEIMACPKGCLNGGGQISKHWENHDDSETLGKVPNLPTQMREKVKKTYKYMEEIVRLIPNIENEHGAVFSPFTHNSLLKWLYSDVLIWDRYEKSLLVEKNMERNKVPFDIQSQRMLHTRFYNVPKLELNIGATAGVAVDAIKW